MLRLLFRLTITLLAMVTLALSPNMGAAEKQKTKKKRSPNPAFAKVVDNPKLPRVLLIGDSISIGYTVATRELLQGKANLHRISTNGGPTTRGLTNIDKWLGNGKWDVIHFNWGLHDLKYIDKKGKLVSLAKGRQQVPIDEYEQNLHKLVIRMKKTGAKIIWCSTTPVPKGAAGRVPGDSVKYNAAAKRVMEKHEVPINDLYRFANQQLEEIQLPANVHFTSKGSKVLATQVVENIRQALKKK